MAQMTMPQFTLMADVTWLTAWPPRMRFEAKKPMYMNTTMPTTRIEPSTPYWARLWIICGMPSLGPCAEWSAMKMAPTRLPTTIAITDAQNGRPKTAVVSAPVMIVSGIRLDVNQMVKRSRGLPWRWSSGICSMVYCSSSAARSLPRGPPVSAVVLAIEPPSRMTRRRVVWHPAGRECPETVSYTYWQCTLTKAITSVKGRKDALVSGCPEHQTECNSGLMASQSAPFSRSARLRPAARSISATRRSGGGVSPSTARAADATTAPFGEMMQLPPR